MWLLFVVCSTYCSSFFMCLKAQCSKYINETRDLRIGDTSMIHLIYCMDFEITNVLTKPGYLCPAFARSYKTCGSSFIIAGHDYDVNWYCCRYQYKPPPPTPTPKPTPMPTISASPKPTQPKINNPQCRSFDFRPLVTFTTLLQ